MDYTTLWIYNLGKKITNIFCKNRANKLHVSEILWDNFLTLLEAMNELSFKLEVKEILKMK